MNYRIILLGLLSLLTACSQQLNNTAPKPDITKSNEDPYIWLEEIEGEEVIDWVKERNNKSLAVIENHEKFKHLFETNKTIYNSNDRIPYVNQMNGFLYNFWRDDKHVRGIYRRTTLESYQTENPDWETILDVDALAEADEQNWVYGGMSCRHPDYDLCLVYLSIGGSDAKVVKEFNLNKKQFVEGGFYLPEAKSSTAWIDENTLLLGTEFGDQSMTDSGYPKIIKLWDRGTELSSAQTIFTGNQNDVGVFPSVFYDGEKQIKMIVQADSFYTRKWYVLDDNNKAKLLELPEDIEFSGLLDGQALLELNSDWQTPQHLYKQGSLLSIDFSDLIAGSTDFQVVVAPTANSSIDSVTTTDTHVFINSLVDVSNVIYQYSYVNDHWQSKMLDLPKYGAMSISGSSDENDNIFINYSNFLTPSTLYHYDALNAELSALKTLPAFFDSDDLKIEQHFVTTNDGTKVPYFLVMNNETVLNGTNPTLLYGYGGFEVSLKPNYSATTGTSWLTDGGIYVLANIRGGGEYGPAWHQAALKENRHVAFNDFIAVAEDLIAKKITSPKNLGIYGGSNGGLLVGTVFTMRPDLFNAVVCSVPLLDMKRYNKLLAGASWMGEYGNPDVPEEWAYIKTYSPYHNIDANKEYPKIFFTTSTRDDRVHPGHARKMAAKLESMDIEYFYYENIEGGHGGASNNNQSAYLNALIYAYLWGQLSE